MVFSISHCTHHHYTGECILEIVSPELSKLYDNKKTSVRRAKRRIEFTENATFYYLRLPVFFYTPSHFYVYLCFAYGNSDIF